ncbi:HutD family protein [Aequorivita sp. H23M31]|uniref:HutD family protein n=1 Tax=Aequorivita ciconiae TaxID=2494375 RepID=A0A410G4C5_9FLAO|nr:HutD family protein [Aequorivita sp. H23M31]QAA82138.1 HutD family protein [Aequorivita sp. H23M31]
MKNSIKKLSDSDFTISLWSGGETTQLYIYPEGSSFNKRDFQARISSATVELEESNFTKLDKINRFLTPLDGNLRLSHDGKTFTDLKPFQIYEFDGSIETKSYGKVRDFNLMLANGAEGELKCLFVGKEKEIWTSLSYGINVLYSYNNTFKITFEEEAVMLESNEVLIIKTNLTAQIKIQSDKGAYILLSRIIE